MVSAKSFVELLDSGRPPANSGAGGSGRFGLSPYLDDGVPGRGPPLRSIVSYAAAEAGGLGHSVEFREGVHGRLGDVRLGEYGRGGM